MPDADRMRRLAQHLKQKNRDAEEIRKEQVHRQKVLSTRGKPFWDSFVNELIETVAIFNAAYKCVALDALEVKLSEDHLGLSLMKREYPYVRANLRLEIDKGCIRGNCFYAAERPTEVKLPETPVTIDLEVGEGNTLYPAIDQRKIDTPEELAGDIIVWFLTGQQSTQTL